MDKNRGRFAILFLFSEQGILGKFQVQGNQACVAVMVYGWVCAVSNICCRVSGAHSASTRRFVIIDFTTP